jgi:hypothetical protein
LTRRRLPHAGDAVVEAGPLRFGRERDQIVGTAIDGHLEGSAPHIRPLDLGLVIAGDKTWAGGFRDDMRQKPILEECARDLAADQGAERDRGLGVRRFGIGLAGSQVSAEGGFVVVLRPPFDGVEAR